MAETEVTLHYIKSHQFRVIHSDGAIGGITPRGLIHMALFSERPAIPQQVTHELVPTGPGTVTLGSEKAKLGREGFVRELEVDVIMDREAVKNLYDWLGKQLEAFRTFEASMVPGGAKQ